MNICSERRPNDSIIDKFDNSRDFLDLFDVNKTGQDSIPEKCLSHFSNHKYGTKSDTNVDYSIVDRFWKLLGRDILDCFLKRQELDDTKEWLNSEIIDSFGGVFKLTVWEDIIRDDEHFDNEWTHINRKRKVFNDKYLMKITNKDAINILLKIIGPLKIGIMLYVKENCYNSFKNCGTEDMLLLDRLIIAHSYSLFPIYYIPRKIRFYNRNGYFNKKHDHSINYMNEIVSFRFDYFQKQGKHQISISMKLHTNLL